MAYEWLGDIWDAISPTVKDIAPAVIGGVISNNATNKAVDVQTAAGADALALQERMYADSQQQLAPYRASGEAANKKLSQLMGLAPLDTNAYASNLRSKYPALFAGATAGGAGQATGGAQQPQVLYNTQQTGGKYNTNWTPENEEADIDYIRRLTGGADVLKGWNPETKTYQQTPSSGNFSMGMLSGQEGYRAAEDEAVRAAYKRLNPDSAEAVGNLYATKLNKRMPHIVGQEANYTNPYSGADYNRRVAIEAMLAGDENTMREQAAAAHYKPSGWFARLLPQLTAGAILGGAGYLAGGANAVAAGAGANATGLTGATGAIAGNQGTLLSGAYRGANTLKGVR